MNHRSGGASEPLFQWQTGLVPSVRAPSQHRDIPEARGNQPRGCTCGASVGLADQRDRPFEGGKLPCPLGHRPERDVDSAWQVSGRRHKFIRLTHVHYHTASPAVQRRRNSITSIHAGSSLRTQPSQRDRRALIAHSSRSGEWYSAKPSRMSGKPSQEGVWDDSEDICDHAQ